MSEEGDSWINRAAERTARTLQGMILSAKARCYRACFLGDDGLPTAEGARVLGDLRRYARIEATIFSPEPLQMARLAGRREVALRIFQYLNLSEAQVRELVEVETDYVE